MSFPKVQIVILIALPLLAALTTVLWLRILETPLSGFGSVTAICLTLASYPVLEGVYAGQPGLVAAALIAGAVAALSRGQYVLAGILLPCAGIKPQMVLLIALWMMAWAFARWSERKRFAISFLVTVVLLSTISTLVLPTWFSGWTRLLREYRQISPPPLPQHLLGPFVGTLLALFLVALAARLCWQNRFQPVNSGRFVLSTIFVLATTALILPSAIAVYDQFLLLPAALWILTRRDIVLSGSVPVRLLALLAFGAVSWEWLAAFALNFASFLAPAAVGSPKFLLLPLRTAASVPFALVALLCLVVVQQMKTEDIGPALAV
jgi:hypothetical protein